MIAAMSWQLSLMFFFKTKEVPLFYNSLTFLFQLFQTKLIKHLWKRWQTLSMWLLELPLVTNADVGNTRSVVASPGSWEGPNKPKRPLEFLRYIGGACRDYLFLAVSGLTTPSIIYMDTERVPGSAACRFRKALWHMDRTKKKTCFWFCWSEMTITWH